MTRFGTVDSLNPVTITDDLDGSVPMPVDVWAPANLPTVGDRVLYDVVAGQCVVAQNISSPCRLLTGLEVVTIATAGTPVSAAVAFPAGWFTRAPRLYGSLNAGSTASDWGVSFAGSSISGVTLWLNAGSAGAKNVWWLAVQQ